MSFYNYLHLLYLLESWLLLLESWLLYWTRLLLEGGLLCRLRLLLECRLLLLEGWLLGRSGLWMILLLWRLGILFGRLDWLLGRLRLGLLRPEV